MNITTTTTTREVIRIAALDLENTTQTNQYFDCESTNGRQDLVWEREGGAVRFISYFVVGALRLDLAHPSAAAVGPGDLDVYYCRDQVTGDIKSVKFTGGKLII